MYGFDVCFSPCMNLLLKIRDLLAQDWEVELLNIPRSANKVADFLAKDSLRLSTDFYIVMSPSIELACLAEKDCNKPTDIG